MGRFDRTLGIARSLAIYGAIPLRSRRIRRIYAEFVRAGDLAFDIGGHVGNRTAAFVALGCRVVVVEPQPDFAHLLRRRFARQPLVTVVEAAVSNEEGHADLAVSDRTPTVSTLAVDWRQARAREAGFAAVRWNRAISVEITTLERLIDAYGRPAFTKIDVEGAEPQVLAGLNHALPALSFEYLHGDFERVRACLDRLRWLGSYRFNWSAGESGRMRSVGWMSADKLAEALARTDPQETSGDVYAQL